MTSPLLTCRALHAGYRGRAVLRGVDLSLAGGETVGLVGENGSGKSTLLDVLAGARAASAGAVHTHGAIAYCPQSAALPPRLTVDETLGLFARALGQEGAAARARAATLLDRFALQERRSARLETLSGGEKQKLSLIAALCCDRPILLLDEPYQALDLASYQTLWALLDERRAGGCTILLVGHLLLDSERCSRVLTLREGVIQ